MMNNLYDKRLQDCGFTKIEETDEIVVYERQMPEFVQVLELGRHEDGHHRICSYDEDAMCDITRNGGECPLDMLV